MRAFARAAALSFVALAAFPRPGNPCSFQTAPCGRNRWRGEACFSISGRVLTRDGRGIAGARVIAYEQYLEPDELTLEQALRCRPPPSGRYVEAFSAIDGSYAITGLEKIYQSVLATAPGFSPAERSDVLPSADAVDLALGVGGELSGHVVDAVSGEVIFGAEVRAHEGAEEGDLLAILEGTYRPPVDRVVTGKDGGFRFQTLGARIYNFEVRATRYQQRCFLNVRLGKSSTLSFELVPGLRIAGTVVSARGEPVAGATVSATTDRAGGERTSSGFDGSVVTDLRGTFDFDTLPPGNYTFLAWHPEHASALMRGVTAPTGVLTITLPGGGALAGIVTEFGTGRPIAGACVSIKDGQGVPRETNTDDKGLYCVAGLTSSIHGKPYLRLQAHAHVPVWNVQLEVQEGRITERDFELLPTAIVSGRVVSPSGLGVAGARVIARRQTEDSAIPHLVGVARTGEDGLYSILNLEGGEGVVLEVEAHGYLESESDAFAVAPGESMEHHGIVLARGASVAGAVVDRQGRGIPGVKVRVTPAARTNLAFGALTDSRGNFQISGLHSGKVDVLYSAPGHVNAELNGIEVVEDAITHSSVVMEYASILGGTVVDESGRPVTDARVQITATSDQEGRKTLSTRTDGEGRFLLEGLRFGKTVDVEVRHPRHAPWSREGVAVNSGDLEVVILPSGE